MSVLGDGAGTIRELVTKLGFDVDERKLEGFERGLETAKVAAEALVLAWHGLVLGLFELTRETAEYGEEVEINSQLLGISTERFQKLRYAAQAFGIENENIITGFRFFNKNLGDAMHGMGEGGVAFHRLGLSIASLKNVPVDKVLMQVADRMHGISNASERAAISVKLFGRGGSHFGQFLSQGSGVIGKLGEQLNGLFMTKEQVEAGQKTHAALVQTQAILVALRNEIGVRLFPTVQGLAKSFLDWVMANKRLIETKVDHFVRIVTEAVAVGWAWFKRLGEATAALVKYLGGLDNVLKLVGIALAAVFSARVISGIAAAAEEIRKLGLAGLLAEGEILLIPAAIAALFLALDDLRAYVSGEDSVLGTVIGPFAKLKKTFADLVEPIKFFADGVKEIFTSIYDLVKNGFKAFLDLGRGDFKAFFQDLKWMLWDYVHLWEGAGKIIGGSLVAAMRGVKDAIMAELPPPLRFLLEHLPQAAAMAGGGPMAAIGPLLASQLSSAGANLLKNLPGSSFGGPGGGYGMPALAAAGPTIHTTVHLDVPPGTPQTQADWLKAGAEATFDLLFNQRIAHALQNTPAGE